MDSGLERLPAAAIEPVDTDTDLLLQRWKEVKEFLMDTNYKFSFSARAIGDPVKWANKKSYRLWLAPLGLRRPRGYRNAAASVSMQ